MVWWSYCWDGSVLYPPRVYLDLALIFLRFLFSLEQNLVIKCPVPGTSFCSHPPPPPQTINIWRKNELNVKLIYKNVPAHTLFPPLSSHCLDVFTSEKFRIKIQPFSDKCAYNLWKNHIKITCLTVQFYKENRPKSEEKSTNRISCSVIPWWRLRKGLLGPGTHLPPFAL